MDVMHMYGKTPLHEAAINHHQELAKLLLDNGAGPNVQNYEGKTALHFAAQRMSREVAAVLVANGAKVDIKDLKGHTPLSIWPELAKIIKEVEAEQFNAASSKEETK